MIFQVRRLLLKNIAAVRALMPACAALFVAACGGGGGGGGAGEISPPSVATSFNVTLGATLKFSVHATAGASIEVSPLPLPPNSSFANGTFVMHPDQLQVGAVYPLQFRAVSGAKKSVAVGTQVSVDPGGGGTTDITGDVFDGQWLGPLSGVTVSIQNASPPVQTTTDATGHFVLSNVPLTATIIEFDGRTPDPNDIDHAFIAQPIAMVLGHALFPDTTNAAENPVWLPPLLGVAGNYDPTATTPTFAVAHTSCGDVTVEIAPKSAHLASGQPYSGPIYIPELNPKNAPAALPSDLGTGFLIAIQPDGILFNPPAKITFPNCDHLPLGSQANIWAISPNTGVFSVVGTGQVVTGPQGEEIVTVSGGIGASSWHMALPPGTPPGGNGPKDHEDPPCAEGNCGCSRVLYGDGALLEWHSTPPYWVLGQEQRVDLLYSSATASPLILADASVEIPAVSAVPLVLSSELILGGATQSTLYTDTSGLNENLNEDLVIAHQYDARSLLTGVYPFALKLTNHFGNSKVSSTLQQEHMVINHAASPYGAGWCVRGVQTLFEQSNNEVLIDSGDGGGSIFHPSAPVGSGLVMQMYSGVIYSDVATKFSSTPPSPFTATTSSSSALSSSFILSNINFPPSPFDAGPSFFYFGPDGVRQTTSTNAIAGDDVWFLSPGSADSFGASFTGYLYLPAGGDLTLDVGVDDSFAIFLDDILVHEFPGVTPYQHLVKTIPNVSAGYRKFELYFGEAHGNADITVAGLGCGLPGGIISAQYFFTGLPGQPSGALVSPTTDFSVVSHVSTTYHRREKTGELRIFTPSPASTGKYLQTEYRDRNGNSWKYQYNAVDALTSVTDPVGQVTTLTYKASGLLDSVVDPFGRTTRVQMNGSGDLAKVIDPDSTVRDFHYDPSHRLVSQTSKTGFQTSYVYDNFGRTKEVHFADGAVRQFTSQASSVLVDQSAGLGTAQHPAPVIRPANWHAAFIDSNSVYLIKTLDSLGRPDQDIDGLGRVTSIIRNSQQLPTSITLPNHAVTTVVYDAVGNPITVSEQGDDGQNANDRTRQFTYDPLFSVTTSFKDAVGNINSATGVTTKYAYYVGTPNVQRITDALGTNSDFFYDEPGFGTPGVHGLLTRVVAAVGQAEQQITTIAYNTLGLAEVTTDSAGRVTRYHYDPLGRVTTVVLEGNDGPGSDDQPTMYGYDLMNRVRTVTNALGATTRLDYTPTGKIKTVTDAKTVPGPGVTGFTYDVRDRLNTRTDPLNHSESYVYDGENMLVRFTDRKGQIFTYTYDDADRLIAREFPGAPGASGNEVVAYGYDNNQNGSVLDDADNLAFVSDADSVLTQQWNAFGELAHVSTAGSPLQPSSAIDYTYDLNGNRRTMSAATTTASIESITYVSDKLNRLASFADTATGTSATFGYNHLSQRTSLDRVFGGYKAHTGYTYFVPSGDLNILENRAGPATGQENLISRFTYSVDPLGRRDTMTEDRPGLGLVGAKHVYSYDLLSQLVGADHPISSPIADEAFTYDETGNRATSLTTPGATWAYNKADQLINSGAYTYTYDLNGNVAARRSIQMPSQIDQFTFDADNQLTRVVFADGHAIAFAYDPLSRRVQSTSSGSSGQSATSFTYDGESIVLEEGAAAIRYAHGPTIDEPLFITLLAGQSATLFCDALGSIQDVIDKNGGAVAAWQYEAFGRQIGSGSPSSSRYGYTGREEEDSDTLYFRHRYYVGSLGRFYSEDPSQVDNQSSNLYVYVANNAIDYVDPYGLYMLKPGVPPLSPELAEMLACIEHALHTEFTVTSSSEVTRLHPAGSPHARGLALDLRYPANPKSVLCAAAGCGARYALDEKLHPSRNATAPHIHLQLIPGRLGGRGDLPLTDCGECGCGVR